MLKRPEFPRQKDVLLIVDNPTKSELAEGDAFSAPSNMNLLTSLRTGKLYANSIGGIEGIPATKIHKTYLDYRDKVEFDYKDSFAKRKDLVETDYGFVNKEDNNIEENYVREYCYYKLDHQKDCYVSKGLWEEFQALLYEIQVVQPKLIIVTGKWAFFFISGSVSLTGTQGNSKDKKPLGGLLKHQSSIAKIHPELLDTKAILLPMLHTLNAITMVDKTFLIISGLGRAIHLYHSILEKGLDYYIIPKTDYIIGVDKQKILDYLDNLLFKLDLAPLKVSIDIETKHMEMLDCIGLSYELNTGICIPFAGEDNPNIWDLEEEIEITIELFKVLNHPNLIMAAQNGAYDCAWFYKLYGITLNAIEDTMVKNHVLYNYMPKDLSTLASLYCEHFTYWKSMQRH